jgi:hypothetical protein
VINTGTCQCDAIRLGLLSISDSHYYFCGSDNSVGIVTELRAGRSENRIPVKARFSVPVQTGPGDHPSSCTMDTVSFLGAKSGQSVRLTPYPLLVPLVMKEWSYTSTLPMGRTACIELQCLYKGDLYLFIYNYFNP